MAKVLVTGATGFIGSNLCSALRARSHSVRTFVRKASPNRGRLFAEAESQGPDRAHHSYEIAEGDVTDPASLQRAAEGCDTLIHCAAFVADWGPRERFREVTVAGTENACRAAALAGVSRFILLSTNDVFGLPGRDVLVDESFSFRPWGEPYPDSKIEAEKIAWDYHQRGKIRLSVLYPCWVFGPGDRTFFPPLVEALRYRQMIYWAREMRFYPTYIGNLCDLILKVLDDERAVGKGFLIHDGCSTSIEKLCRELCKTFDYPEPKWRLPYSVALGGAALMQAAGHITGAGKRPMLTTYLVKNWAIAPAFSIERTRNILAWRPKISYQEGLKRSIEDLQKTVYKVVMRDAHE